MHRNRAERIFSRSIDRSFKRTPLAACLAMALASACTGAGAEPASPYERALDARRSAHAARGAGAPAHVSRLRGGTVVPVTSCADDGSAGTLRAALLAAGEGDTIDLSALTCSTITLTQGTLDIGVFGPNQIYDLSIVGPGRDQLTIDGSAGGERILAHGGFGTGNGTLEISDLTIANGSYDGGLASCIDSSGDVTLTRVDVENCHASGGAPLTFGGAVSVSGLLTMVSSTITGSSTTAAGNAVAIGGAAYVSDEAVLIDSTISGNTATAASGGDGAVYVTAGGGLYVRGELTMSNSTISGNSVEVTGTGAVQGLGGGIFVKAQTDIAGSTFDGNAADGDGGGLFKAKFSNYGDPGTTLNITNSTISGNSAARGAGVSSARPTTLANSTVAFNEAVDGAGGVLFRLDGSDNLTFTFQSSIVADNTAGTGATLPADLGATGTLNVAGADNLIVDAGALALPPDTLGDDPQLEPLADNGGLTRTHALAEGSPAVDAGNNAAALDFDQRGDGFPRVVGAAADIGAFERGLDDLIFADGFEAPVQVIYQYDDGDGDTNQGPPSTFDPDMLWGNYYLTQPGGEVITTISVAFGPTFPSLATGPVTFWLLEDPDMDFDPRNATSLASVQATPDVFNDNFFTVTIPPTQVSGAFFVAASAKLQGGEDVPARVDTDAPGDKSWFFYAPEIADVIDDLASAPFGTRMDNPQFVIFPGAFMIRATGEPAD